MTPRTAAITPHKKFLIAHHRSPGDIVCLTALVRDIKISHPEILIDVDTTCQDLWKHNPYLTKLWDPSKKRTLQNNVQFVKASYGEGIRRQKHETIHFCTYFHRDFKKQTGLHVPVTKPYGDLHLSDDERQHSLVEGRYWVILSGGKSDFTIKVWRTTYFQEVVDRLGDLGLAVVQIGSNDSGHWHPPLYGDNVLNLVGQTNLRDMIRLVQHSDGVICGVTGAQHIAAALQRPCVVIAGGREAWFWEAYVKENRGLVCPELITTPHRFLHTAGLLDCCLSGGCWRNKTVAVPGSDDTLLCKRPLHYDDMAVAHCMDLITPDHVINAVLSYYLDGSLPNHASLTTRLNGATSHDG